MGTSGKRAGKTVREPVGPKLPAELVAAGDDGLGGWDDRVHMSMQYDALDLRGRKVGAAEFVRCRFSGTGLSGLVMRRGEFSDVEFSGVDLANSRLDDAVLANVAVLHSRLTGAAWSEVTLRDVLFEGCRGDLSAFRFSRFRGVVFRDCTLTEANFQGADLTGARFERCRLEGAQFSGATMAGARFTECDLWGVSGVDSFRGAVVGAADARSLMLTLAASLGIVVED